MHSSICHLWSGRIVIMRISAWLSSENIDTDRVFYMRSTVSFRGQIIDIKTNRRTEAEYMTRRYSVIELKPDGVYKSIGSLAYKDGYDSFSPLEPLRKYALDQWENLLVIKHESNLEDALQWTGIAQHIYFPHYT